MCMSTKMASMLDYYKLDFTLHFCKSVIFSGNVI